MLYRYTAIPEQGGPVTHGTMQAGTAADLRAGLRRVGLHVVDMRPAGMGWSWAPWRRVYEDFLRGRRGPAKAELFDALATMLEAGLPISEALASAGGDPIKSGIQHGPRALRNVTSSLRAGIASGQSMAES